ncbi:MAG: hypothetical protein ACJ73S_28950 [Mycobacteriales bacterium]
MRSDRFWRYQPDAPYATLLRVVEAHCHPEAHADAYDYLIELARDPEPVAEMVSFKEQLREAAKEPSRVPEGALFRAACYDDGSDERFLRRLWRDLYGDEVP